MVVIKLIERVKFIGTSIQKTLKNVESKFELINPKVKDLFSSPRKESADNEVSISNTHKIGKTSFFKEYRDIIGNRRVFSLMLFPASSFVDPLRAAFRTIKHNRQWEKTQQPQDKSKITEDRTESTLNTSSNLNPMSTFSGVARRNSQQLDQNYVRITSM